MGEVLQRMGCHSSYAEHLGGFALTPPLQLRLGGAPPTEDMNAGPKYLLNQS